MLKFYVFQQHPLDTQYFDTTFTVEKAKLTPIEKNILQSMDQTQFQGFSYTNPNATDKWRWKWLPYLCNILHFLTDFVNIAPFFGKEGSGLELLYSCRFSVEDTQKSRWKANVDKRQERKDAPNYLIKYLKRP